LKPNRLSISKHNSYHDPGGAGGVPPGAGGAGGVGALLPLLLLSVFFFFLNRLKGFGGSGGPAGGVGPASALLSSDDLLVFELEFVFVPVFLLAPEPDLFDELSAFFFFLNRSNGFGGAGGPPPGPPGGPPSGGAGGAGGCEIALLPKTNIPRQISVARANFFFDIMTF
jgi:hypothetical protein